MQPQPERDRLIDLVSEALALADALGLSDVGISLNAALTELDGEGRGPPAYMSEPE